MIFSFSVGERAYRFDSAAAIDISIPLDFHGDQPNAFGLPAASALAAEGGSFIGDTRRGGSCNCETVTLNPHGNGTHTECVGHITEGRFTLASVPVEPLIPALLVSVRVAPVGEEQGEPGDAGEMGVTAAELRRAIDRLADIPSPFFGALVIRTVPNDPDRRSRDYTGHNPPYITHAAMRMIRELDVEHLLLDLPSADREDDAGMLGSHRIFWDLPKGSDLVSDAALRRTITEMIYVEDTVTDGPYLLALQFPRFELDAAPSRPLLLPLR